jgi:hypothetical protein
MRTGGLSTKNFFSHLISTLEISKSFKNNNLSSNFLYALIRFPLKVPQLFFIKKNINKDFNLRLSEFYKSFSRYDFLIKNKLDYLDYRKNFIYSAMNLAFLGSYSNYEIKNNKYSIFWSDGIFSNNIIDANLKIPGREVLKLLKDPINIKQITVIGNLSNNGRSYLKKLYKTYINHIKLPYGSISDILRKFNYKSSKNELIFTTLPSPKQEILADYISKNNQHFKIVCIGGAISIACGDEKVVPKILYRYEFLWRLQFETRRRIKRLLYTFFSYLYGKYIRKRFNNLKVIYEI